MEDKAEDLDCLIGSYKKPRAGATHAELNKRLSRIETRWPIVRQAHQGDADAMHALLERYRGAISSYLLGALRNSDMAEEVFQEFAVGFLRGKFHRADPARGRFRDFVKTALIRQVIHYRRKESRARGCEGAGLEVPTTEQEISDADAAFLASWRGELLERTWKAFGRYQLRQAPHNAPLYTVLQMHCENPECTSAQLAEQLTARLRPDSPFTDTHCRKLLQRARERFTDLLVDEVAGTLANPSREELERELTDLGLMAYCRSNLDRRFGR